MEIKWLSWRKGGKWLTMFSAVSIKHSSCLNMYHHHYALHYYKVLYWIMSSSIEITVICLHSEDHLVYFELFAKPLLGSCHALLQLLRCIHRRSYTVYTTLALLDNLKIVQQKGVFILRLLDKSAINNGKYLLWTGMYYLATTNRINNMSNTQTVTRWMNCHYSSHSAMNMHDTASSFFSSHQM